MHYYLSMLPEVITTSMVYHGRLSYVCAVNYHRSTGYHCGKYHIVVLFHCEDSCVYAMLEDLADYITTS
jgi:hypothetical protein